jgi:hypothetical protein
MEDQFSVNPDKISFVGVRNPLILGANRFAAPLVAGSRATQLGLWDPPPRQIRASSL